MSRYDYEKSKEVAAPDVSFAALIMAAMRKADSGNAEILRAMWPATWEELRARYDAPGGVLPGEEESR